MNKSKESPESPKVTASQQQEWLDELAVIIQELKKGKTDIAALEQLYRDILDELPIDPDKPNSL